MTRGEKRNLLRLACRLETLAELAGAHNGAGLRRSEALEAERVALRREVETALGFPSARRAPAPAQAAE